MPKNTSPNRRKWNRRQFVAYYREWPAGDHDSVAKQKQITATWAAEKGYEIVEEAIDRRQQPLPDDCHFEVGGFIQEHATGRGDRLYVHKMDAHTWLQWRRSDRALEFRKLSKNQGTGSVFLTSRPVAFRRQFIREWMTLPLSPAC